MRYTPGCCDCEDDDGCYPYTRILSYSSPGNGCNTLVFLGAPWEEGQPITGCFPFIGTCGIIANEDGRLCAMSWVGMACYENGVMSPTSSIGYTGVTGYFCGSSEDFDYPPTGRACLPDGHPGSTTVCVVGCDGEPIPGAKIRVSSDDPSSPFSAPPPIDPSDPESSPIYAGEDGCLSFDYPASLDPDAPISVTVYAPPEYDATTTTTTLNDLAASGGVVEAVVSDSYTCCDMDFRKGPINPLGLPAKPRGKTLLFVTSGSGVDPITGETETGEIEVACDGTACFHSDELAIVGGAPTVVMCPAGPFSDSDWDHWEPPTLDVGKVPALFRVRWDGTDWHCSAKVYYTVARPPVLPASCDQDPSQNAADFFAWFRDDAECDDGADPKLSIAPDPALTKPIGIDGTDGEPWYAGHTEVITVESTSYTVNSNNPVDVTFHFPSVTLRFHGGNVTLKIIDSLTLWEPIV